MSTGVRWMSLAASLGLGWALAAGAQERLDEMATIGEEHMRSGNYGAAIKLYEDIVSAEMPEMPVYTCIPWHENYNFMPDIVNFFRSVLIFFGIVDG